MSGKLLYILLEPLVFGLERLNRILEISLHLFLLHGLGFLGLAKFLVKGVAGQAHFFQFLLISLILLEFLLIAFQLLFESLQFLLVPLVLLLKLMTILGEFLDLNLVALKVNELSICVFEFDSEVLHLL